MERLLNELDELIYVVDLATYGLLYANRSAKELFGLPEDLTGCHCYDSLAGNDTVCDDCDSDSLLEGVVLKRELYNPRLKRSFLKTHKIIPWHGKKARMEVAVDVTDNVRVKQQINERLDTEYLLVDCINQLNASGDLKDTILDTLMRIGLFFGADHVSLYQEGCDGKGNPDFYEWKRPGTVSRKREPSRDLLPLWRWLYEKERFGRMYDVRELEEIDKEGYRLLCESGVKELMCAATIVPKGRAGFIEIDNPRLHLAGCNLVSPYLNFVTDEIQRRRMEQELEYLSSYDELTRAGNRRRYVRLKQELDQNGTQCHYLGVISANVNELGKINTRFGQAYGDHILKNLADYLMKFFGRESVFRTSGDEFVAICVDIGREAFDGKVCAFLEAISEKAYFYAACGAVWDDCSAGVQTLIDSARERMRQDKLEYYRRDGKGFLKRGGEAVDSLLACIDKGQMQVYYQPKVYTDSGRLSGAEALIRYVDDEHGVVGPNSFINRLEVEKTICYLDCFVFQTVGDLLDQMYQEGKPLIAISVNFSRLTLTWAQLFPTMERSMKQWHFPKSYLEIEITERAGGIGMQTLKLTVMHLKAMGFHVLLDDFGVEYTNFSMLTGIEFDVLKLDKTLIDEIGVCRRSQILVESVIDLCHRIDTVCLAEGVETEEQYLLLKKMGCDYIQGYFFGRPVTREEFFHRWKLETVPS